MIDPRRDSYQMAIIKDRTDYSDRVLTAREWARLVAPRIPKTEADRKFNDLKGTMTEKEFFDLIEDMELETYC